jgi:hypothetical protein
LAWLLGSIFNVLGELVPTEVRRSVFGGELAEQSAKSGLRRGDMGKVWLAVAFAACLSGAVPGAVPALAQSDSVSLSGWGESGFLGVFDHKIQFSRSGTYFDYDEAGGQDVLFPFARLWIDAAIGSRHTITFLYQPLRLESEVLLGDTLRVDELSIAPQTPLRLLYNFPFWRLSYLYDFWPQPQRELAVGLSLQIRNATIIFATLDGEQLRTNRDVGPVPLLKLRFRHPLGSRFWVGAEVDGIYAPVSYLNGSDNDVKGALLDAAVRGGIKIAEPLDGFVSLRYLGGGAQGASEPDGPGDGYVKNWLHFYSVSLGFKYGF